MSMFVAQKNRHGCPTITKIPYSLSKLHFLRKKPSLLLTVYMKDSSRHIKTNQFSFVGRIKKKKKIRDNMEIK